MTTLDFDHHRVSRFLRKKAPRSSERGWLTRRYRRLRAGSGGCHQRSIALNRASRASHAAHTAIGPQKNLVKPPPERNLDRGAGWAGSRFLSGGWRRARWVNGAGPAGAAWRLAGHVVRQPGSAAGRPLPAPSALVPSWVRGHQQAKDDTTTAHALFGGGGGGDFACQCGARANGAGLAGCFVCAADLPLRPAQAGRERLPVEQVRCSPPPPNTLQLSHKLSSKLFCCSNSCAVAADSRGFQCAFSSFSLTRRALDV